MQKVRRGRNNNPLEIERNSQPKKKKGNYPNRFHPGENTIRVPQYLPDKFRVRIYRGFY